MGSAVSRGSEDGAGSSHFYFKHNCCRRALKNQRVLQNYQALGNGIIRFPGTEGSKKWDLGFPGGAVVENLPANAGDTGSSPGLGGSHMPRSN